MRGLCKNDSWQEQWKEILSQCQLCQGKPKITPDQELVWAKSYEILTGGDKR
jgi:hypothetical protein